MYEKVRFACVLKWLDPKIKWSLIFGLAYGLQIRIIVSCKSVILVYNGVDKIFTARCYHYTIVFSYKLTTYYITMPRMIEVDDILIRIADRGKLEYSRNDGRSWTPLYSGSTAGVFFDLVYDRKEDSIIALTSNGVFYSENGGSSGEKHGQM